jgi:hypothetical protein
MRAHRRSASDEDDTHCGSIRPKPGIDQSDSWHPFAPSSEMRAEAGGEREKRDSVATTHVERLQVYGSINTVLHRDSIGTGFQLSGSRLSQDGDRQFYCPCCDYGA